jgi:hypothetical protein
MFTVVIARPPFTYTTCSFLLYNSILEKLYFLLLHVESGRFLVPLSSKVVTTSVIANVATTVVVAIGVAATRGNASCC